MSLLELFGALPQRLLPRSAWHWKVAGTASGAMNLALTINNEEGINHPVPEC